MSKKISAVEEIFASSGYLEDFIFQNNLEAFQNLEFFKGLTTASVWSYIEHKSLCR